MELSPVTDLGIRLQKALRLITAPLILQTLPLLWTGVCTAVSGKARLPGADASEGGSCQLQHLCPAQSEL